MFSVGSIREFLREYEIVSGSRIANFADVDLGLVRSKRDEITMNVDLRFRDEVERLIDMLVGNEDVMRRALSLGDDVFNNVLRREFDFVLTDLTGVPSVKPDYSVVSSYFPISGSKGLENVVVFRPDGDELRDVRVDTSEFTIYHRWRIDASNTLRRVLSRVVSVSIDKMSVSLLGSKYKFGNPKKFIEALRRLDRLNDYMEFMYRNVMSILPDELKGFEVEKLVGRHPITGEVDSFAIIVRGSIDGLGINVPERFSGSSVDFTFIPQVMYTTSMRLNVDITSEKLGLKDLTIYTGPVRDRRDVESMIDKVEDVLSTLSELLDYAESNGYGIRLSRYDWLFNRLPFTLYKGNIKVDGLIEDDGVHARVFYVYTSKINMVPDEVVSKLDEKGLTVYPWSVDVSVDDNKTYISVALDVDGFDELFSVSEKVKDGIREAVDEHVKRVKTVKRKKLSDSELLSLYLLSSVGTKLNVELLTGRSPSYVNRRVKKIVEKMWDDSLLTKPTGDVVVGLLVKKNILSFNDKGDITINGEKLTDVLSRLGVDVSKKEIQDGMKSLSRRMLWEYDIQGRLDELAKIRNSEFLSFVATNSNVSPSFFARKVGDEYVWNIISSEARKEYIRLAGQSYLKWMAERPEVFREDYASILNSLLRSNRNIGTELLFRKTPEVIGVDESMTLYKEKEFRGIRSGDYVVQVVRLNSGVTPSGDKVFLVFNAKEKLGFPVIGKTVRSVVKYASSRWSTFKDELRRIEELSNRDVRVGLSYYGDVFKVPVVEVVGKTKMSKHVVKIGTAKIVEDELEVMKNEEIDNEVIRSVT